MQIAARRHGACRAVRAEFTRPVGSAGRGGRPCAPTERRAARGRTAAAAAGSPDAPAPSELLTGVVFSFKEIEPQLKYVDGVLSRGDVATSVSLESVELSVSYVYLALAAFFDRDNVGLPGFAAYFRDSRRARAHIRANACARGARLGRRRSACYRGRPGRSFDDDERTHAQILMAQQNRRGGRVQLAPISRPITEYFDESKGDVLNGVETALGLERLNFLKLRALHAVASEEGDAEMTQFVEDNLLRPQAREVKLVADLFSRVRRAGPGHGVVHIDLELQRRYGYGLHSLANDGLNGGDGAAGGDGGGLRG
ncbi:hypothetical protein Rsub_06468 [Raphidocelis subcapitata]|uniref:Ferritin n=1 Tax=Raphidocelis subcapitata TaxID=307507 RepID=A0A2V0P2V5_9CHLO|nr:hypothetical protein Rsub_06468 [Raphidocelis subcapitata]|eukprot:GBF94198.1 hypothetical protein Rsub_06468 [Raphidocelis subcapitata]